jgi:hypothetical protein
VKASILEFTILEEIGGRSAVEAFPINKEVGSLDEYWHKYRR